MDDVIQSYGLLWEAKDVSWGAAGRRGSLLGVPAGGEPADPVDFREQVGVYVLYRGHDMVYVGQTGSGGQRLLRCLKRHLSDHMERRWDRFSWFGLRRVLEGGKLSSVNKRARVSPQVALDSVEAILIAAAEPPLNTQGGVFSGEEKRYLQVRDERLDSEREGTAQRLFNGMNEA